MKSERRGTYSGRRCDSGSTNVTPRVADSRLSTSGFKSVLVIESSNDIGLLSSNSEFEKKFKSPQSRINVDGEGALELSKDSSRSSLKQISHCRFRSSISAMGESRWVFAIRIYI